MRELDGICSHIGVIQVFTDVTFFMAIFTTLPSSAMHAVAKSAFGLYALYRAVSAEDGRAVIYSARKGGHALFKNGKAYMIPASVRLEDLAEMSAPTTLYISDSLPPAAYKGAFRLLITSPKKENWSEFAKSPGIQQLVLPVFSEGEMLELRSVAFSEKLGCKTDDEVLKRFALWGGSARSVLTYGAVKSEQDRLTSAACALSISLLEKALQGTSALDGVALSENAHRLIKMVPYGALPDSKLAASDAEYFRFHHAELMSDHVVGLFADNLQKRDTAELYRFLHAASSDPAVNSLRGVLYERCFVLPRLMHGPKEKGHSALPLQRLSGVLPVPQPAWLQVTSFDLPKGLHCVYFSTAEDLQEKWADTATKDKDAIFVPYSKQFPVVDFVLRIGGQPLLCNATVGMSHAIKLEDATFEKLLPAVGLDSEDQEIPFVWVLDKPAHQRFNKPGPLKSEKSDKALASGLTARHATGRRLAQYKLLLEVPPVLVPSKKMKKQK